MENDTTNGQTGCNTAADLRPQMLRESYRLVGRVGTMLRESQRQLVADFLPEIYEETAPVKFS